MVEQIKAIGELLKLPDLEDETKQLINECIRKMLGFQMTPHKSVDAPQGIDPFKAVQNAEQQAKELLGANTMNEWINGPEKT